MDYIGGFGLTEPKHGSDSLFMETTCEKTDNGFSTGYVLNGEKRWIGNATIANFIIVFAEPLNILKNMSGIISG